VCHSEFPDKHAGPYAYDDCLSCHDSAHDPANRAYSPGYNLSQRDYMSQYFVLADDLTRNNFRWTPRGNHEEYNNCSLCHLNAESVNYTTAAENLMNVNGTDCSTSCHSWIDPQTTSAPITLLTSTPNPFSKHSDIFNNATTGGCAGLCHQGNPTNPVFDGSGHGTVTNCLSFACHGNAQGFQGTGGTLHTNHGDYLAYVGLECFQACHRLQKGEPIDGGCYDCHKSGHDPRINTSSPCYQCHSSNMPSPP
jgi:hypothetical protein